MNKAIIMGRLTRDPAITYKNKDGEQLCIARFSLAVSKTYKPNNENNADFLDCVAFGKNGQLVEQYCRQGTKIAVEATINTYIYEYEQGKKIKQVNFKVDKLEFCESKKNDNVSSDTIVEPEQQQKTLDEYQALAEGSNNPFNY